MADPSPRNIVSTVRAFVRRHGILRPGPLVLAVSGGADSTALALVARELAEELGLVLHVAHFDHRTRVEDAPADAAFVAEIAARIDAPIRVGRATRAPASEDEARTERYAFLRRVAKDIGATAIATGHTLDDQAETVVLHLVRGSGIAGLSAMRPLRDGIARPLLPVGRAETEALCRAAGIRPREDPSNRSLRFARNRVRLKVLPELAKINPRAREAIARVAEAAAEAVEELATPLAAPVSLARVVDLAALPDSPATRERLLASAWREATGRALTARQREALAALASSHEGTTRIDLPGGAAVREYARLRIAVAEAPARAPEATAVRLHEGSWATWHGWRIGLGVTDDGVSLVGAVDPSRASALAVRSRRPGDRVSQRKKLQDVFVDAKVPVRLRDTWPVIALEHEVVWVPGLTPPPDAGDVTIVAQAVGQGTTTREDLLGSFRAFGRVASRTGARRQGGKRGRR